MTRHIALAAVAAAALLTCPGVDGPPEGADGPSSVPRAGDGVPAADPGTSVPRSGPTLAPVDFWLTLLHHNDGESGLLPRQISGFGPVGGVARFATLVDSLRSEALRRPACRSGEGGQGAPCGVLLVSSGDNFLPGPVFDVSLEKGVPFYDGLAMDLIGYDVLTLGNHDFDFGPDVLADFIRSFPTTEPPFLSANLDVSREPALEALRSAGRIAGSAVVETGGRAVGVVGATTEVLPTISTPRGVRVLDARPAVQREIDRLLARGIDRIVLVSHLQSTDEDRELVSGLRGVDVVIAGGGDELLANADDRLLPGDEAVGRYPLMVADADGDSVPVVTTVGGYRYVGRLRVGFADGEVVAIPREVAGPRRVAAADSLRPDGEIQSRVVEPVLDAVAGMRDEVVAIQEPPLDATRAAVRTRESNVGNLVADALLWQARQRAGSYGVPLPEVALQHGGGIRTNRVLPPGELTTFEAFELLPFANFVTVVPEISRSKLLALLEYGVSNVESVDARFAQVAGLRYRWDPAAEPGRRIVRVTLEDGTEVVRDGEVVPGPAVTVATIEFLAQGGDGYPFGDASFTTLGVTYQQALVNYARDALGGEITAAAYPEGGTGRIERE